MSDKLLQKLNVHDPRVARLVELRYFGGLTFEEAAEVLGVTSRTAKRDWDLARSWLYDAMNRGDADDRGPLGPDQESV